jgi:lipopolysaccharide export LptBFGC system permease protein LptF
MLRDILQWIISGKVHFIFIIKSLCTLLPAMISYALPAGLLCGTLIVFGDMSEHGEILTMQTAGMSIFRIAIPVLLLSLIGVASALSVNLFYGPRAMYNYRRSLHEMINANPLRFLQPQQFISDFPGHIFYAGGRDENGLHNLRIWELNEDNQVVGTLHADSGILANDTNCNSIQLILSEGSIEQFGKREALVHFGKSSISLPLKFSKIQSEYSKRIKHMDLWELSHILGESTSTATDNELSAKERNAANFAIQQRLSMAFSACTMTIFGIPLALRSRQSGKSTGISISIAFAFAYYFATTLIGWMQYTNKFHAECLVWIPNAVLALAGVYFFQKHARPS